MGGDLLRPLLVLSLLSACTPAPGVDARLVLLQHDLNDRYGETHMRVMRADTTQWIELTMRDDRFRGLTVAAPDSTEAIAKYAAARLPAEFGADSIKVTVLVESTNLGVYKTSRTAMRTYPIGALR